MENKTYNQYLNDPRWLSFSDEVKRERNYTCEDCGYTGYNLKAHHIKYDRDNPKRLPWDYYKKNLRVLCAQCHAGVHGIKYAPSVECGPCDGYLDYVEKAELRAKEVVRAASEELIKEEENPGLILYPKAKSVGKSQYCYDLRVFVTKEEAIFLSKTQRDLEDFIGKKFSVSRMFRLFVRLIHKHYDELRPLLKRVETEIW